MMIRNRTFFFLLFVLALLSPSHASAAVSEDVIPRRFSLSAVPANPMPGDAIKVEAQIASFDSEHEGLRWSWQGDGENFHREGEKSIAYKARTEPASLVAVLWDRSSGEDLASASLTVAPISFDVALRLASAPATTLQTWNSELQSPETCQGIAVETPVVVEALVSPTLKGSPRYVWTVQEGSFLVSQDQNHCVIRREVPGTTLVTLSLHEADMNLGSATLSFDVPLSSEELKRSRSLEQGWALRAEALALQKRGEVGAALSTAERSTRLLTEGGVDEAFLRDELGSFKSAQEKFQRAQEIGMHAAALWRDGKPEAALEKYKEAVQLYPHPALTRSIEQLEALLLQDKERREKALALVTEARNLANKGEMEAALQAYDRSLTLHPLPSTRGERANLEGRLKAIQQRQALARIRRTTALSLEAQGDLEEALKKMAESREIWDFPGSKADQERLQKILDDRRTRQDEAAALLTEALNLENKGAQGDRDPALLSQALEKYNRALELWPDEETKRSLRRLRTLLDETEDHIKQADLLSREGDLLEREGRLQEAKNRYIRAQDLRKDKEREIKLLALERRIRDARQKDEEARQALNQALELEKQGRFDEALSAARHGASTAPLDELAVTVARLENSIAQRHRRIGKAEGLAGEAREALEKEDLEKALDLFLESQAIWPTDLVSKDIQALEGQLTEKRDVKQRAETLYNEALAFSRADDLEEAWEKLQASSALLLSPKVQELSSRLRRDLDDKTARDALLAVPLRLQTVPRIPRTGERTLIRVSDSAWTADKKLNFHWKATENALGGETVEGGKGYRFYPGDTAPVTVVLTVQRAGRELTSKTFSVTAEPWTIRLVQEEPQGLPQRWDENLKRLTAVNELMTQTDVVFHAEIVPLPDFPVVCRWTTDPDTAIVKAKDNEIIVRRAKTGTGKIAVSLVDERDIPLGTAQTRLLVTIDKSDVLRDVQRAQAWELWTSAQGLWEAGGYRQAIETAGRSLTLDPSSPEIEAGLLQMKVESERKERVARLLAESSALLSEGKLEAARGKAEEALSRGDADAELMLYAIAQAEKEAENERMEATRLRSEAEAYLTAGGKKQALIHLRNSYLLSRNEAVSQDIARLAKEIGEEERVQSEALALKNKGDEMADKQRFSDALHFYEQSIKLHEDGPLKAYMQILEEKRAEEEKIKSEAARLKQKGDALMAEKKTSAALGAYKESLSLWQDEKLNDYVKKQERALAQSEAQKLRKEAEALIKRKKNLEAAEKYRQSLAFAYDKTAEAFVKKHEAAATKEQVQSLIRKGDVYVKQKKMAEALATYRLAFSLSSSDQALQEKIKYLETILHPASVDLASETPADARVEGGPYAEEGEKGDQPQADLLVREGNVLFKEQKYREALQKYEASYTLSKNEKLKDFIVQLTNALKGTNLVQEGNALYKEKKYKEALEKYQESLLYHQNPEVERFIQEVKSMIR